VTRNLHCVRLALGSLRWQRSEWGKTPCTFAGTSRLPCENAMHGDCRAPLVNGERQNTPFVCSRAAERE